MTLAERCRAVRTREDLIAFVAALAADYETNGSAWTNTDLASFFAAMSAWSEDMAGSMRTPARICVRYRLGAFSPTS